MSENMGNEMHLENGKQDLDDVTEEVVEVVTEDLITENESENGTSDVEEELTDAQKLKLKSQEIKDAMLKEDALNDLHTGQFSFKNEDGEYVGNRKVGEMWIEKIPIEKIKLPPRNRIYDKDLTILQEQIKMFGLIEPIVVIEVGDYYLLVSGARRLQATTQLGNTMINACITDTIDREFVKYFEGIANSKQPYTFTEQLHYGKHFLSTQDMMSNETVEGILGLKAGDFLKAQYIESFKGEFLEVYNQVEKGKLTIEQAFKKIEKEIEKREKEESAIDELNSGALDDQLRSTNELLEVNSDAGTQEVGNRKVLDPVLRRSIENRDSGFCQCCGYGKGEPDLMGVFNVHHMVAVQYGGSDNKDNLILVCNNCHTLVHDYERGRFLASPETIDRLPYLKKVVVLGNILATMKKKGLSYIKAKHPDAMRVIDAGKKSLGKTLLSLNIDLKGEELFNGSPYKTFLECASNIDNDIVDNDEHGLQEVNWADDEEHKENNNVDTLDELDTVDENFMEGYVKDIETVSKPTETIVQEVSEEVDDNLFEDVVEEKVKEQKSVTDDVRNLW